MEIRQLIEDFQYTQSLPNLPNVPVVVLTGMIPTANHTAADMQLLFQAHEALKTGVTDFTHVAAAHSGHYIMFDEPNLVTGNLNALLAK